MLNDLNFVFYACAVSKLTLANQNRWTWLCYASCVDGVVKEAYEPGTIRGAQKRAGGTWRGQAGAES